MHYFMIDTMGNSADQSLCFISDKPDVGMSSYKFALGKAFGSDYPTGVRLALGDDFPGIKLTSFIGNARGLLIFDKAAIEVIQSVCDVPMEILPFVMTNHKGRVHSENYAIVHLVGTFDCLDYEASGLKFSKKGNPMGLRQHVLSAQKVEQAPDLFRIEHAPAKHVASERLVQALEAASITNFVYEPLRVVDG